MLGTLVLKLNSPDIVEVNYFVGGVQNISNQMSLSQPLDSQGTHKNAKGESINGMNRKNRRNRRKTAFNFPKMPNLHNDIVCVYVQFY